MLAGASPGMRRGLYCSINQCIQRRPFQIFSLSAAQSQYEQYKRLNLNKKKNEQICTSDQCWSVARLHVGVR